MKQKTILITAGPTKEYIDPIRFISNDSSGKMGYLLAKEAKKRGYKVVIISGPVNINPPKGVHLVKVVSAMDMYRQVLKHIEKCNVFISCAAVADYRPEKFSKSKIKKTGKLLNLKLVRNPDILKEVSKLKSKKLRLLIGFALETDNLMKNAKKKMAEKRLDMIVANDYRAINSSKTSGAIIMKNGIRKFYRISKQKLVRIILDSVKKI